MDRDRIVAEIRRTAKENGDIPLGRMRFHRETGIKEADWLGRHWARWSDAIAKAGFPPNAKQEPLEELLLLKKLVEIVQALGKWPTDAELKLYRREHQDFPSHNTFRRLGNRRDQIQKLTIHQADIGASRQVLEICERVADISDLKVDPAAVEETRVRGYVYLVKSGRYHKIGHSNDPSRRTYELRLQLPEQVEVVHQIETEDPAGIEAYWHRRFSNKRAKGEWFVLAAADIAAFKSRTAM